MKVSELIAHLNKIGNPSAEVDVMIETNEPTRCQYQFPANDVAYDQSVGTVIILHEKWNGEDE